MINKSLNYMLKLTLSYCLKCRRNTKSKNPEIARQKSGRIILLSKFVVYNSKKSKYLKEQVNWRGVKIPVLSDLAILSTLF